VVTAPSACSSAHVSGVLIIRRSVIISATGHDGPMGAFCAKRLVSAGVLKELVSVQYSFLHYFSTHLSRGTCAAWT
jgi:ribulose 1,5-bisphosphate synthetase/thiazole synthase